MSNITVSGLVATTPRHIVTVDGLPITSFRLADSFKKWDYTLNKWVDGETNWYTITSFKSLAVNVSKSISKGDRIFVTGKIHVRDFDNGERAGVSVEVVATNVGHDLSWGTSEFTRNVLVRETEPEYEY